MPFALGRGLSHAQIMARTPRWLFVYQRADTNPHPMLPNEPMLITFPGTARTVDGLQRHNETRRLTRWPQRRIRLPAKPRYSLRELRAGRVDYRGLQLPAKVAAQHHKIKQRIDKAMGCVFAYMERRGLGDGVRRRYRIISYRRGGAVNVIHAAWNRAARRCGLTRAKRARRSLRQRERRMVYRGLQTAITRLRARIAGWTSSGRSRARK